LFAKELFMQLKSLSGTLSVVAPAALFLAVSAAWALPAGQSAAQSDPSWLAGTTARLDHAIDARNAKQGDVVEAKVDHTVKTPDGTEIPSGTELRGTVVAVQAPNNGGPASLTLRFDKAELKNGGSVPVKVTVVGAYPNNESSLEMYGQASMGPAPRRVTLNDRYDQKPGTLRHIAMNSRASSEDSATFSNDNGDVKLRAGTFLQVGIARQGGTVASGL
jgi:hypothetical protein